MSHFIVRYTQKWATKTRTLFRSGQDWFFAWKGLLTSPGKQLQYTIAPSRLKGNTWGRSQGSAETHISLLPGGWKGLWKAGWTWSLKQVNKKLPVVTSECYGVWGLPGDHEQCVTPKGHWGRASQLGPLSKQLLSFCAHHWDPRHLQTPL